MLKENFLNKKLGGKLCILDGVNEHENLYESFKMLKDITIISSELTKFF